MANPRPWTCPDCGTAGLAAPDQLPPTEFTEETLAALHQWARFFEYLNHDAWSERHPGPPPTILDFVHWLVADHRTHRHVLKHGHPPEREVAGRSRRRNLALAG